MKHTLITSLLLGTLALAACGATSRPGGEAAETTLASPAMEAYDYRHAVAAHRRHPAMRLQDYYKTFYQDRFGPAHLMADTAAVVGYLMRELATPDTGALLYEPAGDGERFMRVYCRAVGDGLCTADELALAFMASAQSVAPWPHAYSWRDEWDSIQRTLRLLSIHPEGAEEDSAKIADMLSTQGDQAVSHSAAYRAAYAPHYRIVARPLFDSVFLPRFQRDKVLIILTDKGVGKEPVLRWMEQWDATLLYDYATLGGLALRLPDHLSTRWAEGQLQRVEGVLSVEWDQVIGID